MDDSQRDQLQAMFEDALVRVHDDPYRSVLQCLAQHEAMLTLHHMQPLLSNLSMHEIDSTMQWLLEWGLVESLQHQSSVDEPYTPPERSAQDFLPPSPAEAMNILEAPSDDDEEDDGAFGGITSTYWGLTHAGAILAQQV